MTAKGQEGSSAVIDDLSDISSYLEDARTLYADADKQEANQKAKDILKDLLQEPQSFGYSYDSLKHVTILESEDGKVRIFTWNLMLNDLSHQFYGFIQYHPEKDEYYIHELKDKTDLSEDSKAGYHYPSEWYGAIYYDIIEKKHRGNAVYTLLGWKGQNALVQQKVIETLEFGRKGLPEFGDRNFRLLRERKDRIIFRYSIEAQMILRYNNKQDLIVCDHLSPGNPKFTGHWEYYGPDYSYDAFEFDRGRWYFKSNIDPEIAINYKKDKKIEQIEQKKPSKNF
jgi:hypothetical protein